ncbi:MAG: ABC transporter permease [Lachnospiraceae bacterium]
MDHEQVVVKRQSQLKETLRRLFKNKLSVAGLVIILILVFVAVFADWLMPYDYAQQDYKSMFLSPGSPGHILGTDDVGRDILSRLIYGSRLSLQMGFFAVAISAVLGDLLGAIAGYFGGVVDDIIMRFLDIYQAVPTLVLCIALAAVLGAGLENAIIAIGIANAPWHARLIRGSIMQVRDSEYVEAARAINAGSRRIILRHILPNILAPTIVQITMDLGNAILNAATLSFIGLGAQVPLPEWGAMLSAGREYMRDYGYMVLLPGICIILTVLSLNLLGDGLRDALDPRLKD